MKIYCIKRQKSNWMQSYNCYKSYNTFLYYSSQLQSKKVQNFLRLEMKKFIFHSNFLQKVSAILRQSLDWLTDWPLTTSHSLKRQGICTQIEFKEFLQFWNFISLWVNISDHERYSSFNCYRNVKQNSIRKRLNRNDVTASGSEGQPFLASWTPLSLRLFENSVFSSNIIYFLSFFFRFLAWNLSEILKWIIKKFSGKVQ